MMQAARDSFIAELRREMEATCPCCQRRARINKMRVHSTLALMLARLYYQAIRRGGPFEWVHINDFRPTKHSSGRDFCIVKYWQLAEAKPAGEGEDKNSSGFWRLTARGRSFIFGDTRINRNAFVMDDTVLWMGDELISMQEAIKNKFSYSELLIHLKGGKE